LLASDARAQPVAVLRLALRPEGGFATGAKPPGLVFHAGPGAGSHGQSDG